MADWILALSFFLHLVATVVWIGGLFLISIIIWPEARALIARREGGTILLEMLDRLRKRFHVVANLSLFVLLATGLYQMDKSPHYDGLLQFNNDWSRAILLKHIAVVGMIVVGALMQWSVIPALERVSLLVSRGKQAPDAPEIERLRRRERRLTLINGALGVFVLFCTAVATAV